MAAPCPAARRHDRGPAITKPRHWAYSMNAWLKRGSVGFGLSMTLDMLSGIITAKRPPKKPPRRFAPRDHRGGGLGEAQPHKAVPREHRSEDQRLEHPAPV